MSEEADDEPSGASAVLGLAAALLRRDAPALAGLAALLLVIPTLAVDVALFALADGVDPSMADLLPAVPALAFWLADVAFKGGAIHAAVAGTAARPVSLGRALRRGLADYPGNLALMALTTLGITLGLLLLVLPGVALQCRWLAALPAMIGERLGPRAAMARSRALSRDASGTIFGLLCYYAVSERIATWIATVPGQGTGEAGRWVVLALGLLVSVLFATLSSVGSAAVYLDLRRRAGGAPPAEVVEAFA